MMRVVGYDMAAEAAQAVYEKAGIGPMDIKVVELHDCFAQNELITYEGLGLCAKAARRSSSTTATTPMAAAYVTNPSGGLLSKGPSARRDRASPSATN
jgi:sterol carrier protein 2